MGLSFIQTKSRGIFCCFKVVLQISSSLSLDHCWIFLNENPELVDRLNIVACMCIIFSIHETNKHYKSADMMTHKGKNFTGYF